MAKPWNAHSRVSDAKIWIRHPTMGFDGLNQGMGGYTLVKSFGRKSTESVSFTAKPWNG